jgi:ATP-dependent RNA helicase RhlE
VVKVLLKSNIRAEAIHGNKAQNARQRALENFKAKTTRVLVATDIAARGIDVDDLAYVINFEMPNIPETYVHRIGRTGRAGANGTAFSFCENHDYPMSTQPVVDVPKPPQNQHQNRGAAKPNEANKGKKVWFKRK